MRGEDVFLHLTPFLDVGSPPHARGRRCACRPVTGNRRITPACAGKTSKASWTLSTLLGSPPHARGRLGRSVHIPADDGITPACAGKTDGDAEPTEEEPDHPRMRGEDFRRRVAEKRGLGSPPHARGRPWDFSPTLRSSRITPACAGKTARASWRPAPWRDHPRMRGEDQGFKAFHHARTGSPPHARGRRTRRLFVSRR